MALRSFIPDASNKKGLQSSNETRNDKTKKRKKKTAFQKAPTPFLLGRKQMYECFVRCSFSESGRNVVIRRRNLTEKAGAEFVFMFYDFYHPL